ncbi:YbaK/EbsC family protein [Homoserinibacter sp. YIM 151385]|uniref:YbaK/EbsC family protein n=1 Tax=Homoserinibacter sp. YIM 151385 TaxID=2985506 RepID=UPI0022F0809F|nr:YbaK/EbsC family protein [Homoserinibacter sp. YIM 151385]WBU38573.1 YbaK/EbsC family protein [Homoserinibacter sp. YIM 151385]
MSAGVERFRERVAALGVELDIRVMTERTHTAQEAAEALGCRVEQIVKSLVFEADGAALLVLASGPTRVDTAWLGEQLGTTISKADAALVKRASGYSIGGVPPFAHDERIRTVVDRELLGLEELWAAAGSDRSLFPIAPALLMRLAEAEPVSISR